MSALLMALVPEAYMRQLNTFSSRRIDSSEFIQTVGSLRIELRADANAFLSWKVNDSIFYKLPLQGLQSLAIRCFSVISR